MGKIIRNTSWFRVFNFASSFRVFNFKVKQRFVLASMMFFAIGISYSFRLNFPLLLTQMVYPPYSRANNDTTVTTGEFACPVKQLELKSTPTLNEEDYSNRFHWPSTTQGSIISSLLWGNIAFQIPGGILVQWFGGKTILLASSFLSAISFALSPTAVFFGDSYGLIIVRLSIGVSPALLTASLSILTITWFPVEERGRAACISMMGFNTCAFISSYLMGLIMEHTGRWDFVFYGFALATAITSVLLAILIYDNPQTHPYIGAEEQKYLKSKTDAYLESEKEKLPPTPWRSMITNKPVLALMSTIMFFHFGAGALNNGFSKYLNDVLHVSILDNSIYNSLPRILNMFLTLSVGFLSDYLYSKRNVRLTTIRKSFTALSSMTQATFAIGASYAGCDETLVATLSTIALAGQAFDSAGVDLVAYDLAPNYIAPLSSLILTIMNIASMLSPYVISFITPHSHFSEWRSVFWLTFSVFVCDTIIFTIWGSAEVQPWNSAMKPAQIT